MLTDANQCREGKPARFCKYIIAPGRSSRPFTCFICSLLFSFDRKQLSRIELLSIPASKKGDGRYSFKKKWRMGCHVRSLSRFFGCSRSSPSSLIFCIRSKSRRVFAAIKTAKSTASTPKRILHVIACFVFLCRDQPGNSRAAVHDTCMIVRLSFAPHKLCRLNSCDSKVKALPPRSKLGERSCSNGLCMVLAAQYPGANRRTNKEFRQTQLRRSKLFFRLPPTLARVAAQQANKQLLGIRPRGSISEMPRLQKRQQVGSIDKQKNKNTCASGCVASNKKSIRSIALWPTTRWRGRSCCTGHLCSRADLACAGSN